MAECAYAAIYAMRDPKGKAVSDLFPSLFDDDEDQEPPITDDEMKMLQAEMDAINAANDTKPAIGGSPAGHHQPYGEGGLEP